MNYPLRLSFKILALAPQIRVLDAAGAEICYVKQKLFRLKEQVEVFADSSRRRLLCTIRADRIIDFNASYTFHAPDGTAFGCVRRRGFRSLWKAHYEMLDERGGVALEIREENPFVKILDGLLGDLPVVGMCTGLFLNPQYAVGRNGSTLLRMSKRRAFLESRFTIDQLTAVPAEDELRIILSLLMFVLLERSRG